MNTNQTRHLREARQKIDEAVVALDAAFKAGELKPSGSGSAAAHSALNRLCFIRRDILDHLISGVEGHADLPSPGDGWPENATELPS